MCGPSAQRRLEMVGEFAEVALVLARDLQQAALAAEDAGEKARLAEACHRIGRGLRQSLALHERLERLASRGDREDAQVAVQADAAARARRKVQARAAVARLVWREYEPQDATAEELLEGLDLILDSESELDGFDRQDLEPQVAELCAAIGYEPLPGAPGVAWPATADEAAPDASAEPPPVASSA